MSASVPGYCPMGCGQTLFAAAGGFITCSSDQCPRSGAVSDLLDDSETEHVVKFGKTGFTVRHPLRERLDDALMDCVLHEYIAAMSRPPVRPGRYRARQSPDGWIWLELGRAADGAT